VPLSDETDSARTIFATTQWTVVLASAESQAPGASAALTHLCQTYWKPLFGYVRQRGYPVHEAQDLVQDFFVYLLEKRVLAHADRTRGRFRTFLLTCLQNFLTSAYRHANTQRRGGDVEVVPLDSQAIDEMERASTRAGSDPVEAFDAAWAQAVFDRAIARLRTEADDRGRRDLLENLSAFLTGESPDREMEKCAAVASRLGVSLSMVKTAISRLRQRFRALLREEVAATVAAPDEVDEELQHLRRMLLITLGQNGAAVPPARS
jgi:RNA polymerase sigma factor (sigma-70 family)